MTTGRFLAMQSQKEKEEREEMQQQLKELN